MEEGTVVAERSDVAISVDRNKMCQVVHNLVSNAIKFTPQGGRVTVTASLERASRRSLVGGTAAEEDVTVTFVKVAVVDTGVGLTEVSTCDWAASFRSDSPGRPPLRSSFCLRSHVTVFTA